MEKTLKNTDESKLIASESELKHLKFEAFNNEHVAILVDEQEYEIIKGYGRSQIEALNDLHSNLI